MPSPRFDKLPPDRRREILEVAARHFAQDGLEGASVARILGECGLTRGAAYYYFVDKNDLFATVFEHIWAEMQSGAGVALDAIPAEGFWGALGRLYRHQVLAFTDRPWLWTLGRSARAALQDPKTGPALAGRLSAMTGAMHGVIARGQALGAVRTDLPLALLASMFEGLDDGIDAWLAANPEAARGPEGEALVARCFESLRRVLEPGVEVAS